MPDELPDWHIETDYQLNADAPTGTLSPYSFIEHPFRIIVHNEDCDCLLMATATFGPAADILASCILLVTSIEWWFTALILNRIDLSVRRILVRPTFEEQRTDHATSP